MRTVISLLLFCTVFNTEVFSQEEIIEGAFKKEDTKNSQYSKYAVLREADAMWSKRVWRVIDLNEKMNLAFKYPSSKQTSDRKNLIDVIMDAIEDNSLVVYGFEDDEFIRTITLKEILSRGGARIDSVIMQEPEPPYEEYTAVIQTEFSRDKVIGYRIKEDWFFDKQRSVMDVRIVGIAPLIYAVDETGAIREGNIKIPLFWIYYPEARDLFSKSEIFNPGNNAQRLSYDDVFQKRLFGSYIYKESNVYDRRISDYTQGLSTLQESERVKEEIINFEHDMWEF
jgi:gliding motility associated protien GldN